jgi:putative ABC transport system permease protein
VGTLIQDIHYSLRSLRKSPGFALAAVLALGFGIGMNSAVFTILNAIALKPLPVRNANEVMTVFQTIRGLRNRNVHGDPSFFSYAEYAAYRDQNAVFTDMAAYAKANLTLAGGQAREVAGHLTTCNYFEVLSGPLVLGRGFRPDECGAPGGAPVVVLSYGLWKNQLGGDPEILGRSITLNGHPFVVIGVAPDGFRDASITIAEVWAPLVMQEQWIPNRQFLNDANLSWLEVVGRLKPGVSPAEARVNLSVIAARLDAQSPPRSTTIYVDRATLMNNPRDRGAVLGAGAIVLAAISLVLLIACANLANFLLARGTARQKEIALRLAVGASRVRVIRQLLTESLLLAFAGGAAGLLAAWATLGAVVPIVMSQLPSEAQWLGLSLSPDVRIVAYSILLSIATAVGFWDDSCCSGIQDRSELRAKG